MGTGSGEASYKARSQSVGRARDLCEYRQREGGKGKDVMRNNEFRRKTAQFETGVELERSRVEWGHGSDIAPLLA